MGMARAGLTCSAEKPDELAARVLKLFHMFPNGRLNMGKNGRRFCIENYDREKLFVKLEKMMKSISG